MADLHDESEEVSEEDDDLLTEPVIEKYRVAGTIAQGSKYLSFLCGDFILLFLAFSNVT